MAEFTELKVLYESYGQGHIFQDIPDTSLDEKIMQQLRTLDFPSSLDHFRCANETTVETSSIAIEPVSEVTYWSKCNEQSRQRLIDIGRLAIKGGKVAALILSGGQGTRLGFSGPKGMYNMGLPSGKSIFQIHIERIMKVRNLCQCEMDTPPSIPIYIMTSDINDTIIRQFFKDMNNFNYPSEDIIFFQQGTEPCLTFDGKLLLESSNSIAVAPDGNGGIFSALQKTNTLSDMIKRGIEHLHVYGIDNILTKSVDPAFIGLCIDKNAHCGNKTVTRANKNEKVGLVVNKNNRMHVVEYSEIPTNLAEAEDSSGNLVLSLANICNHYFNINFLQNILLPKLSGMYHKAIKKIPYYDNISKQIIHPIQPNGIKLELFIFDAFPFADNWVVMEVDRNDEFAPVKNEPGNKVDSPDTARALLSAQGKRWLHAANIPFVEVAKDVEGDVDVEDANAICEISPLISYEGEGLEALRSRGTTITLPCYIDSLE